MATQDREAQFIDIGELRIGMFVYLDLGLMQHPFARNSFRIGSRDQIDTLLNLGVERLRWSPEKSDPVHLATAPDPLDGKVGVDGTAARQAVAAAGVIEPTEATTERRLQREMLRRQRASLEVCERQFSTAARAYRQALDAVRTRPEAARTQVAEVVDGMVGTIIDNEEPAIRLLSENIGERTAQHSVNVTVISLLLGNSLGLDAAALHALGTGALLHDIGKLELPERLRWEGAHFNAAERMQYQEHIAHGLALSQKMQLPADVLAIIEQHHEMADGGGYPHRLAGEQIMLLARIVALVNHYDNLCNPANPIHAITPHEALARIFAQARQRFSSRILMSLIHMMGVYPPGSVVELSDGRMGLVVSVNAARPLKPNVIIYEPRIPPEEALVEYLEQSPDLGIRRSLKPLQLPKAAFDYLSPRQRICYFFERARGTPETTGAS